MSNLMKLAVGGSKIGPATIKQYIDDIFNINSYTGNGLNNRILTNDINLSNSIISNTVTTSGSIVIPYGVTSISLVGKGNDGVYNPGTPGILPGYDVYGVLHTTDRYAYTTDGFTEERVRNDPTRNTQAFYNNANNDVYAYLVNLNSNSPPSSAGITLPSITSCNGPYEDYTLRTTNIISIDAYRGTTGIAPYITAGAASTATINGITYTFPGGTTSEINAVTTTFNNIIIPGTSLTLVYTISSGGNMIYSYSAALKKGLVLIRARDRVNNGFSAIDNVRGPSSYLELNATTAQQIGTNVLTAFNNGNITIGVDSHVNASLSNYVAYSFAKATNFFDIVTYTGNGIANRILNHTLGSVPGMITSRSISSAGSWITRHNSSIGEVTLDQTVSQDASFTKITGMTDTTFSVSNAANINGVNYIAYLFGHDTSASGLIQCGSYMGGNQTISNLVSSTGSVVIPTGVTKIKLVGKGKDSINDPGQPYIAPTEFNPGQPYIAPSIIPAINSTATINGITYTFPGDVGLTTFNITIPSQVQNLNYAVASTGSLNYTYNVVGIPKITLGWEPQLVWIKNITAAGAWVVLDNVRGLPVGANGAVLTTSGTAIESQASYIDINPTGFTIVSNNTDVGTTGQTYVYMAIRRPNKPATSGSQVYNAIARNGTTGAVTIPGAGFNADLCIYKQRSVGGPTVVMDKLRGGKTYMLANTTAIDAITGYTDFNGFTMDGVAFGSNYSTTSTELISLFKRYPKVFDIVNFNQPLVNHNLDAVPELMIIKSRSAIGSWNVYHKTINSTKYLSLESSNAATENTFYNGPPTDTTLNTSIIASSSVSTITITNSGSLYTSAPSVNFSGGGGSGVTGIANMYATGSTGTDLWSTTNGLPQSVDKFLGTNYTSAPSVNFSGSSIITMPDYTVNLYPLYQINNSISSQVFYTIESGTIPDGDYINQASNLMISNQYRMPVCQFTIVNNVVTNTVVIDAGLTGQSNDTFHFHPGPTNKTYVSLSISASVLASTKIASVTYSNGRMNGGENIFLNYSGGGGSSGSSGVSVKQISYATTTYSVGSVTINTAGNGYLTPPTISFSGGSGSNAAATAVLGVGKFDNYIGYLFATYHGISKVFDYIGNGTSQSIPCGFSNGARFIMLKCDNGISDWFMWDTTRGIVAGNDPHLSINTTVAEVITDDTIDPDPSGFIINQLGSTNMNILNARYIGFAIA